jgi:hypothetical protein
VALNKVLLQNNKWPFILQSPLNSDLTIGIDVKNNTAGMTLIYKNGSDLRFCSDESEQKEQLSSSQLSSILFKILKGELEYKSRDLKYVSIHRDGKMYNEEIIGIKKCFQKLKRRNLINKIPKLSFIEILKTSPVRFRFFDIIYSNTRKKKYVNNPRIGLYTLIDDDAYLCTTGKPYHHKGTVNPLHVKFRESKMNKTKLLDDIFKLSCLTWTKPDDCSRIPLSIKMTDINLRQIAGEYDLDRIKYFDD